MTSWRHCPWSCYSTQVCAQQWEERSWTKASTDPGWYCMEIAPTSQVRQCFWVSSLDCLPLRSDSVVVRWPRGPSRSQSGPHGKSGAGHFILLPVVRYPLVLIMKGDFVTWVKAEVLHGWCSIGTHGSGLVSVRTDGGRSAVIPTTSASWERPMLRLMRYAHWYADTAFWVKVTWSSLPKMSLFVPCMCGMVLFEQTDEFAEAVLASV